MDVYVVIFSVLAIIAGLIIFSLIRNAWNNKKLVARFRRNYGKAPSIRYEEGDFEHIPEYYLYRLAEGTDDFIIDDITWNDLNLDGIFVNINAAQTNCGEQYLYNILRMPQFDRGSFEGRCKLIDLLDGNEQLRLKLQKVFAALGRKRGINLCEEFKPADGGSGLFALYCLLSFAFIALFALTIIFPLIFAPLLLISLITNIITYMVQKRKIEFKLLGLNYALCMISAAKKINKLNLPQIDELKRAINKALKKLGILTKLGTSASNSAAADLNELFSVVFLWDLIRYEFSKLKICSCYSELISIFEIIGKLDSAISIASYRKSVGNVCRPKINFECRKAYLKATGLVHPLINNPVLNDFLTDKSMLLTGSNASGKSTYLKTVMLNAVYAQTIGFCLAKSYEASAMHVYSSMALRDDLAAGESYYIVEIKSLGRILKAAKGGTPVFCVVDEVLRGTNTVERIAASSEILLQIAASGALCLAATHDIELASILAAVYDNRHFQEYIEDGKMKFDYKLHDGPTKSRNAIKLLGLMGYDDLISDNAEKRAAEFLTSGKWGKVH